MSQFAIGILARETHVNIETIRYYEREGVLPEPARSPSGYRQYSPEDVKRLHFIRLAKEHGFSLSEIRELLNLRVDPSTTCNMVRHKAEVKIRTIEKKRSANWNGCIPRLRIWWSAATAKVPGEAVRFWMPLSKKNKLAWNPVPWYRA